MIRLNNPRTARTFLSLLLVGLVGAACQSISTQVQTDPHASVDYSRYRTFEFGQSSTHLPSSMEQLFREELAAVLIGKGLTRSSQPDLWLTYNTKLEAADRSEPENVSEQDAASRSKDFGGSISMASFPRQVGNAVIQLATNGSLKVIYEGSMSRLVTPPGDMDPIRKRAEFRQAFDCIFQDYPVL